MGLVRITSLYPKLKGGHFGLPPSSIHEMTGLGGIKGVNNDVFAQASSVKHNVAFLVKKRIIFSTKFQFQWQC